MKPQFLADSISKLLEIDIRKKSQLGEYVRGRALYYYVCKQIEPRWSLIAIGEEVNTDHATVLHGIRQYNNVYRIYFPKLIHHEEFLITQFKDQGDTQKNYQKLLVNKFKKLKEENESLKIELHNVKTNKNNFKILDKINELLQKSPQKDLIIERLESLVYMESKKIYL